MPLPSQQVRDEYDRLDEARVAAAESGDFEAIDAAKQAYEDFARTHPLVNEMPTDENGEPT